MRSLKYGNDPRVEVDLTLDISRLQPITFKEHTQRSLDVVESHKSSPVSMAPFP